MVSILTVSFTKLHGICGKAGGCSLGLLPAPIFHRANDLGLFQHISSSFQVLNTIADSKEKSVHICLELMKSSLFVPV